MSPKHSSTWTRFFAAGLAAAAIAPATAAAAPTIEGQGVAAGGGPGMVGSQDFRAPDRSDGGTVGTPAAGTQDHRTPDRVDGAKVGAAPVAEAPVWPAYQTPYGVEGTKVNAKAPVWPAHPRSLEQARAGFSQSTADDGMDTGVLIAIGGALLVVAAVIGVGRRARVRPVFRQRTA